MTQPDCNACQHCGKEPAVPGVKGGPLTILTDCRHKHVGGLMGCDNCLQFSNLELFGLVKRHNKPPQLRCPVDGCRHVQDMPRQLDWRVGFVGARLQGQSIAPPKWCPGFEPRDTAAASAAAKPAKKQVQQPNQPCLF